MNTPKHTPGPWYPHYAKADHCLSSSVWGQEPGNQVAVIGGKSLEAMNANARLIAAAPAMYEALKALLAHEGERQYSGIGTEHDSDTLEGAKRSAKTALAQAEGRDK